MDNVGSSAPVGAVGGRGQVYTYTLQSEGDNKAPNVDMLYAVVDKSHKKKK